MDINNLTRPQLARCFGVHPRTISRWYQEGLPRHRDGTYDLPQAVNWAIERAKRAGNDEPEPETSQRWLAELRKENAAMAKIQRMELEKQLYRKEDVHRAWAWRVSEVTSALEAMVDRLAPLVVGKKERKAKEVIAAEVRQVREAFARPGEYCEED